MNDDAQREMILADIRRVACDLGADRLTRQHFKRHGTVPESRVRYYFSSWNAAVAAAGLEPNQPGPAGASTQSLDDDVLLRAIGDVWRQAGRRPTEDLMNCEGAFTVKPYRARWRTFGNAVDEFVRKFGAPALDINGSAVTPPKQRSTSRDAPTSKPTIGLATTHRPSAQAPRRPKVFGEPLEFRGLRYAPVNEQGVVYLFGMVSRELGFLIESVRTDFPDCEGKRALDASGSRWQHVRIEFEYHSSNFREHGHDPAACDLIVCWVHDWPECPLEVLDLKTNIARLGDGR